MIVIMLIGSAGYLLIGMFLISRGGASRRQLRRKIKLEWGLEQRASWVKASFRPLCWLLDSILWPSNFLWNKGEVRRRISIIEFRFDRSLPWESYCQVLAGLSEAEREDIRKQLATIGFTITGFAKRPGGIDVPVSVNVTSVGWPIALIQKLSSDTYLWAPAIGDWMLGGAPLSLPGATLVWFSDPDTEVWTFSSDAQSWSRLTGRAGLARVKNSQVQELFTTVIS